MKKLIAALALILSPGAFAQGVEVPPCFPLINGVHVGSPRVVTGDVGQHVFWFCSPRGGEAREYGFSCAHGKCSQNAFTAAQQAIIGASARVTAAQTQYTANVTFQCKGTVLTETTERGSLCRERVRLLQAFRPTWVPQP